MAAWNGTVRYQYLLPSKRDKIYINAVFIGIVVNIILNCILIPKIEIKGAIIATIIAEIVTAVIQTYPVRKEVNAINNIIECIPLLIIGLVMYFIIRCYSSFVPTLNVINLVIKILIGAISYTTMTFIYLKVFKKDMLDLMIFTWIKEEKI